MSVRSGGATRDGNPARVRACVWGNAGTRGQGPGPPPGRRAVVLSQDPSAAGGGAGAGAGGSGPRAKDKSLMCGMFLASLVRTVSGRGRAPEPTACPRP